MEFDTDDLATAMSLISLCRFCPSDDQLILNFLTPKAMSLPLPYNRIKTVTIDKWTTPKELADKTRLGRDLERYYFARIAIFVADDRREDVVGGRGYWEPASEHGEEIFFNDEKIGEKRELIYCETDGSKTPWVMHEYKAELLSYASPSSSAEPGNVGKWAVYKLRNTRDVDVYETEEAATGEKRRNLNEAPESVPDESDDVLGKTAAEAAAAAALFVLDKLSDNEKDDEPAETWMETSEDLPDPKRRKGNTTGTVVGDDSGSDDENKLN